MTADTPVSALWQNKPTSMLVLAFTGVAFSLRDSTEPGRAWVAALSAYPSALTFGKACPEGGTQ